MACDVPSRNHRSNHENMQPHPGAETLDDRLFLAINGFAGHSHVLDRLMIASAKYLPVVFAMALVALWLTRRPRIQRGAFLAGSSALIALVFGQIVGKLFPRSRPFISHAVTILVSRSTDTSFPSDHATLGFAVAVMVWMCSKKAGAFLLFLAVLLAFSRVYVGAHYPLDVLGGAVLGSLTSWLLSALSERPPLKTMIDRLMEFLSRWRLAARNA